MFENLENSDIQKSTEEEVSSEVNYAEKFAGNSLLEMYCKKADSWLTLNNSSSDNISDLFWDIDNSLITVAEADSARSMRA